MRLSMRRYKTDNLTRVLWDKMQTQVLLSTLEVHPPAELLWS